MAGNLEPDCTFRCQKTLANDKILPWLKLKAFADGKIIVAKMLILVFDRVKKNMEKGENAGYQHFLLFP